MELSPFVSCRFHFINDRRQAAKCQNLYYVKMYTFCGHFLLLPAFNRKGLLRNSSKRCHYYSKLQHGVSVYWIMFPENTVTWSECSDKVEYSTDSLKWTVLRWPPVAGELGQRRWQFGIYYYCTVWCALCVSTYCVHNTVPKHQCVQQYNRTAV